MKLWLIILLVLTLAGPLWLFASKQVVLNADYRIANRASAHLAPDPRQEHAAIIQVYAARAFNWRGLVSTHTWIATKQKNHPDYTVYEVIGWRRYWGLSPLLIERDIPDRYWYGQKPQVILDLRGKIAEELIPKIDAAAKSYPWSNRYDLWPGPNSNTLPAWIGRNVPQLGLVMPANAIGKDYLPKGMYFAKVPSGTGYQLSVFGVFGIMFAVKEGLEINLLGFVFGLRFAPLAILLPGIGAVPVL